MIYSLGLSSVCCTPKPKSWAKTMLYARERSRRSRRPSNPAEAALAAATEAAAAVAAGVQRIATPLGEQFETPDPALWSVHVDVRLPNSQHAVGVRLKVHAVGQMTLEWPSFGGLQHGQANISHLPAIETLSLETEATARPSGSEPSGRQRPNTKTSSRQRRWSFARRQVDADISDDDAPATLQEAVHAATHRAATMEDVHAMVMALVDRELSECEVYDGNDGLFTLRDSSGAMLVHNLLLAGAQGKDPRAHKLFLEIVHKVPRLLLDVHDGRLVFHGEGPLHVLAVNGRSMDDAEVVEKVLVDCLRTFRRGIAERKISPEELVSSRRWTSKKHVKWPHDNGTKPIHPILAYSQASAGIFEPCASPYARLPPPPPALPHCHTQPLARRGRMSSWAGKSTRRAWNRVPLSRRLRLARCARCSSATRSARSSKRYFGGTFTLGPNPNPNPNPT